MKKKSTHRMFLKPKTSVKRYILTGISFSFLLLFAVSGFFYLQNNEEAKAASNAQLSRESKNVGVPGSRKPQGVFELFRNKNVKMKTNTLACKPKSGYKKKKFSGSTMSFSGKQSKTPYKYVYATASSAPPQSSSMLASHSNHLEIHSNKIKSTEEDDDYSPLVKVPVYTWSKNLSPEERKIVISDLNPSKELPPIRFITNQDEFSVVNMDSFMEALELVNQGKMVLIEGHTDDLGSAAYNLNLSMKRVQKIRQLMLDAGADEDLIAVKGYGESKPLVANVNDENRQINRRIEFKIFDL